MSAAELFDKIKNSGEFSSSMSDLKPEDIVFFSDSTGKISHTGVVSQSNGKKGFKYFGEVGSKKKPKFAMEQRVGKDGKWGSEDTFAGGGRPSEDPTGTPDKREPSLFERFKNWVG